jgi:uncharacterized membrane-anchored protein
MNRAELEALWQRARVDGLLPAEAAPPPADAARPWPVVLLTALGAWLAAVPLVVVLALAFGPMFEQGGAYFAGVLLLAAAVVMLRSVSLPRFLEQLAVPLLLTGGASLGFALFRDLPSASAAAVMAALALGLGLLVRGDWLKVCLGAAAAVFAAMTLWPSLLGPDASTLKHTFWLSWHLCVAAWLLASMWEGRAGLRSGQVALAAGWLAMCLLGLALSSGMAMLVGANLGGGFGAEGSGVFNGFAGWPPVVSAALALLAAGVLGRAWASVRRPAHAAVALVLAGLAAFMPALGAVLLALAICAVQARWRLAGVAALAALWIVGAFYYQLAWPLATKALVMAAAGALLGALAWLMWPRAAPAAPGPRARHRGARLGAALSLAAVLAVINVAIAQKEALIADGQPVFVPLAPADPRSLMQGDFMRLNFALPRERPERDGGLLRATRPQVVATLDARRVARLVRLHGGGPLAPGELLIELTPKDGRWTVVSDAWFFKEGDAQRWSGARFGEFRVQPDGKALLVGLRGEGLKPL